MRLEVFIKIITTDFNELHQNLSVYSRGNYITIMNSSTTGSLICNIFPLYYIQALDHFISSPYTVRAPLS